MQSVLLSPPLLLPGLLPFTSSCPLSQSILSKSLSYFQDSCWLSALPWWRPSPWQSGLLGVGTCLSRYSSSSHSPPTLSLPTEAPFYLACPFPANSALLTDTLDTGPAVLSGNSWGPYIKVDSWGRQGLQIIGLHCPPPTLSPRLG